MIDKRASIAGIVFLSLIGTGICAGQIEQRCRMKSKMNVQQALSKILFKKSEADNGDLTNPVGNDENPRLDNMGVVRYLSNYTKNQGFYNHRLSEWRRILVDEDFNMLELEGEVMALKESTQQSPYPSQQERLNDTVQQVLEDPRFYTLKKVITKTAYPQPQ